MILPGIFGQRDARWSNQLLGYNQDAYYNLYHFGCAVVSASNLLMWKTGDWNLNPSWVNQWLKNNGGFAAGGGLMIWGKLAELLRAYGIQYHGFSGDLNATNRFLSPENNFAIAQLRKVGFPMHFSAMPYVGQLADSWDAKLKPVGSYTFIGAHLYTFSVPKAAPVALPVLEPAPVQAPVEAPTVPVPSSETPVKNPTPENETPPVLVTEPEWELTWTPFEQEKQIKRDGAFAIDAVTGTKVADIPNHYTTIYAGTFERNGHKLYRTPFAVNNDKWFGVDSDFFDEVTGQTNGEIPVNVRTNDEIFRDLQYDADSFKTDVSDSVGAFRRLFEVLARFVANRIKRKGL